MDGRVLASTLPRSDDAVLAERLRSTGVSAATLGRDEYAVLPRPLIDREPRTVRSLLILRSRAEQLLSLTEIQTGLAVTAVVAVLLATLLSFAVARTITRPLAAITDVMREVARTGDLTRKITLGEGRRWHDEDAELLATTFNTLTESVARIQREMSQKERLSALGRLSTVIAHEVRNPLMIIKGSLHALRQKDLTETRMHEAVADINEEVERLNRLVNEVLDFARPIRFEIAPADLNALCRESATASHASAPGAAVSFDLDATAPTVATDAGRLRIALVNMLVNARHAVNGASGTRPGTERRRAASDAPHARERRSGDDRHRRSWRRNRAGPPGARLRSILHHQAGRHRSRPRRSPRTSSKDWAAPSASTARPARAPRSASTFPIILRRRISM